MRFFKCDIIIQFAVHLHDCTLYEIYLQLNCFHNGFFTGPRYVTFHAKTYINGFVFNGLSRWVAVGNPLKAFMKPLEVLGKPLCFFHYPLEVLKKAVGNCFPSRWKCWKLAV